MVLSWMLRGRCWIRSECIGPFPTGRAHTYLFVNSQPLSCAIPQVGAALYAARVPERFRPGKFDYLCNSHNLFHVAVVIAALIHYRSVMLLLHWRDSTGTC